MAAKTPKPVAEGVGPTLEALERDLAELDRRLPGLSRSARAAAARAMARDMDSPRTSPTARSMSTARFDELLEKLFAMAPAKAKESPLDEIRARRDAKLAGKPASARRARTSRAKPPGP